MWWIMGMIGALGVGIYVGLGMPGTKGREDRIVTHGRARRLPKNYLHWFKPKQR